MTIDTRGEYARMVGTLAKDPLDIADGMTAHMLGLIHMAMGIAGEAGELLDAIKKAAIYNKPLDMENVIEELGDLEFYMEGLRQLLDITRHETLEENFQKLNVRYAGMKYSDAAAQTRADKA